MARNKMGRPLTRDEREAAATLYAEVTGRFPIRDHVTRESIETGGTVRLDPTNGGRDEVGSLIAALVEQGAIKILPTPAAEPASKADKPATQKG